MALGHRPKHSGFLLYFSMLFFIAQLIQLTILVVMLGGNTELSGQSIFTAIGLHAAAVVDTEVKVNSSLLAALVNHSRVLHQLISEQDERIVGLERLALSMDNTLQNELLSRRHKTPLSKEGKGFSQKKAILAFLHIGKSGGTSFDSLGAHVAQEKGYKYVGHRHFEWSYIEKLGTVGQTVDVVLFLRHPVDRAVSHFFFAKTLPWTHGMRLRAQNLTQYVYDKVSLLETRDIWQDGQAGVSWLTGTHIASWAGVGKEEVVQREEKALNATAMCHLAADRLEQVKWFGLLEDLNRSMLLLQKTFNLRKVPTMPHSNKGRDRKSVV